MSDPLRLPNLSPAAAPTPQDANPQSPAPALWPDGASAAMTQLRGQIRRVAPYFRTALLTGERGCGEEAAARILHQFSPLKDRPFVILNSAEAERLLSRPDAHDALAGKGMCYIPRPERIPKNAQNALLHLVRKYGSQAPRIVAFAERGLRPLVSANSFSAELADCLGALRIVIPPLRDRREDVPHLLTQILEGMASQAGSASPQLTPALLEAARRLPWPGNLPQLYATAEGLFQRRDLSGANSVLDASDLEAVLGNAPQPSPSHRRETRMMRLDDVVQEHIRSVLLACNGNKLRTAEVLGISRSTLYRMLDASAKPGSEPLLSARLDRAG